MLYVLNTNLNSKKKLFIAFTEIYGLGKHNASQICDLLGISVDRRLKQLSSLQLEHLTQLVNQNYNIGSEIKRSNIKNIQRLIKIASYKGFRHTEGLPVRGQRTHGNSRTRRKLKGNGANILNK
uniref:Small ribosomal subunit protein uS13m n=1 Tax=Chlorella heliozoae TaxID=554066 RepID=A0A2I4S6I2_9CHLO|nr:ribosomal protein S13 [Chlorella heliozoae]